MKSDEITALAFARRKSFRSHLHVRLRPLNEDATTSIPPPIPPLPVSTTTSSVTQSVPNLAPTVPISDSTNRPIGFSCTQSVPDLTTCPPPPDPPPKQFFSSTSASNVFLFPPTSQDPNLRHSLNSTTQAPTPQTDSTTGSRSQSTPPVTPKNSTSPLVTQRQTSQSDPETPKSPSSPSQSKFQRHKSSSRKAASSKPNSPNETRKLNGDASSSSGQDSPTKPGRRQASVYFKRNNGSLRRTTSVDQTDGTTGELTTTCSERERSNSDVSSRTSGGNYRRKMSSTGRESGKVPWCGCWGNGCL